MSHPPAELRILEPRKFLLGTGNPDSLQNVISATLPDGAVCYVLDQRDWYVLDKFSTDPVSGTDVVAATTGRWKRQIVASSGVAPVAQTFFVDEVNFSASPTGTLSAPYRTIQQAIDQAVVLGWAYVNIMVAPSDYVDPIAIPLDLAVAITGWGKNALPTLSGAITITGGISSAERVSFENCVISAASIAAADPLTQDLNLSFFNCENFAPISGFNIICLWQLSTQAANVTAGGGLSTSWDDWSWSHTLNAAPAITAGGVYTRNFWGAGHDTYERSLTVAAVAIGTTVFQAMAVPAYVEEDDHVTMQVSDPNVRDFICGIHGVDAGSVVVWLTNLSRVSTDFDEAIRLLIHHNDMIVE
jgi:hypothetical protein